MPLEFKPLLAGVAAILPAGVVLFLGYGRYDGFFKDNVVFLFFLGGLLLGGFVSLIGLYFLLAAPLIYVLFIPVLEQVTKMAVLNRRKWQGDRHSVFNGGALGVGVASMIAFTFAYRAIPGFALVPALASFLLASGIALLHYSTGIYLGRAVAERSPLKAVFVASFAYVPLAFIVEEASKTMTLFAGRLGNSPVWIWLALGLLYGVAAFAFTQARVLPRALPPQVLAEVERKERRAKRTR